MQIIGHTIKWLDKVSSTNDYCIELCKSRIATDGMVVATHHQTNGRGQRGSVWNSKKYENLTFSICLFPKLAIEKQFEINKIGALAIGDFLKNFEIESKIKWPNDILVKNKKISGMLVDSAISGNYFSYMVVGFGINVNQLDFNELNATSIKIEKNKEMEVKTLLLDFLELFQKYYNLLQRKQFDDINDKYLEQLYGYKTSCKFEDEKGIFKGVIEGVDESGRLKLTSFTREKKIYQLKELKMIL